MAEPSRNEKRWDQVAGLYDRILRAPVEAYDRLAGNDSTSAVGITPDILEDRFEPDAIVPSPRPRRIVAVLESEGRLYAGQVVDPHRFVNPNEPAAAISADQVPEEERSKLERWPLLSTELTDLSQMSAIETPAGQIVEGESSPFSPRPPALRAHAFMTEKGFEKFQERALKAMQRQQAAFEVFEDRARNERGLPGLGDPVETGRLFAEGVTFDGRYVVGVMAVEVQDRISQTREKRFNDEAHVPGPGGQAVNGGLPAIWIPGKNEVGTWEYLAAARLVTYPPDTDVHAIDQSAVSDIGDKIFASIDKRVERMGNGLGEEFDEQHIEEAGQKLVEDWNKVLRHYAETGEYRGPDADDEHGGSKRQKKNGVKGFIDKWTGMMAARWAARSGNSSDTPEAKGEDPAATKVVEAPEKQADNGSKRKDLRKLDKEELSDVAREIEDKLGETLAPKEIRDSLEEDAGPITLRALLLVNADRIKDLDDEALRPVATALEDLRRIADREPGDDGRTPVRTYELRHLREARHAVQGKDSTDRLGIFPEGTIGHQLATAIKEHGKSTPDNGIDR